MKRSTFAFIFLLFLSQRHFGQTADQLVFRADSAYEQRKYVESARLYEEALRAGVRRTVVLYNAARSFALAGNKDKALRYIDQAVAGGWRNVERMKEDSDFVNLRADARWAAIFKKAQAAKESYDHLDALVNQLNYLGNLVLQYRIRSKQDGGGGGSFAGYELPSTLTTTPDGTFEATVLSGNSVELTATSVHGRGTVSVRVNASGTLGGWKFGGELKKLREK
ncbi:MAG: hypothetical protein HY562_12750 [Ignavibacteriales bacterium]|nr:hypothetical protein [Ignavibacteriales bacterium]